MGRGERIGSKNNSKGHVWKRNVKSDDSDEDYMLEEDEPADQSDELVSLVGDASDEESLGSFVEEEEENVRKAVRQKTPKRSNGRTENGTRISKRRKRIVSDEEDDEDYDYEEEDADVQNSRNRSIGRRKNGIKSFKRQKRIVSDEDDEDYDYEEENNAVAKTSCKRSIGQRKNGIKSFKRQKRIVSDEDDEDYDYEEEDNDAYVERSCKKSIGQRKNGIKSSKKGEGIAWDEEDDKDCDYVEEDNDAYVERSCKKSTGRRKNGYKRSKKRETVAAYDEEDEDDYDYEEEEEEEDNDVDVERSCKKSTGLRKNGIKVSKKRETTTAYDEDDDDDDDYDYEEDNDADADVDSIGGGGGGDDDDYDDEDEYEEDDDDDFTLEELDFLDEEEEHPSSKGKKGQGCLKKKGLVRSRKRKTGTNLKRHGSSRSNMPTSGRSRKSMKKVLSSRGRWKRRSVHTKKKAKPCSDSDFVSSEPSDYVFTTSEEEREQVREANEFCRRSSSNLRSSKQDEQDAAGKQLKKLPKRKGKEKVDDIQCDVGKQVCGICLTEEGKNTTRGALDCCSHFFCFACIMEWSKVESRCPLCKQRFSTISKPARNATRIDTRNEVIHVPERDQVYQPSEEELRNYLDPYENVLCTECHEGGDDALMLLCDLCDSPAHTYCVGLGREVPEGNWYCEGCRPSALGLTSLQAQDLTPDQRLHNSSLSEPSFENMAEIDLNITIPETPMTPVNGFRVSPRQLPGGSLQAPPPTVSGVGVSTLSGRRRVHLFQFRNQRSPRDTNHTIVDRASGLGRTDFSGPWGNRAAQSAYLEIDTADVGTSYHADNINRLQVLSSAAQNTECFSRRPSLLRGQALLAPPADSSDNGCGQLGGVVGINSEHNCAPGREWLQPCPSRLNLTSQASTSPSYNRDVDQNIVKQQIKSSVNGHLKNIRRDVDLGYDTCKQIARGSVHTILAACGLDHSVREVHEMRSPICLHYEELVGPQMSLIKGCCQACFDSFVGDVVRTIMDVKATAPQQLSFRNY